MASDLLGRIEEWRRKLLDLTNRNQLVNCKSGPRAAIRLEYPSRDHIWSGLLGGADLTFAWKRELVPEANETGDDNSEPPQLSLFASKLEGPPPVEPRITLEQCLESQALSVNHLLTDLQDRALGNRLNRISLNARTALSEQGVNVLFVAFGFLKWFEAGHSDEPRLSPLLLVPVCLERIGATAPWKLSLYEDEITPNFCLRELMKRDFHLQLPEVDPQSLLDDEQSRERYETAVRDAVRNESGWEVLSDAVLGQFSFQKLAMYDDYGRHATEIAEHEHCRRIAGDDSAPPPFAVAIPPPARFDTEVHPSKLHTILPCDSSQLEAILAIKSGASLVLDGPPGTGKSQTIANVIAECLADGKTVLFVSEKAAALEVVKQRLDDRNLGDFALNCHSHKASKKEIVVELGRCLNLPCEEYASRDGDLERLYRQRERLNAYVRDLHIPHPGLGVSVFDIHGQLAVLANAAVSRCEIPNVLQMDTATLREIIDRLRTLADCRRVVEEFNQHPWRGCLQTVFSLAFEDEARIRLSRLAEHLTRLDAQLQPLATAELLASAPTLAEVESGLKKVGNLLHAPSVPVSWLKGHPRAIADGILRIAEWSSAFRTAREECDEFVDAAVNDIWLVREGGLLEAAADKWSSGLRPHSATTVRSLHSQITLLSSDLCSLADLSNEVERAGFTVLDALKIPTGDAQSRPETLLIDIDPKPRASGTLSRISLDAEQSTRASETLFATLTNEDDVNAIQAELERKFVSAAFGKRGQDVAHKVRKFRRIWKAVFPKWRLMRKKIESFYHDESSLRPSALVYDVEQLHAFFSDSDQLAREINIYEDAIVRGETGRVCWRAVRSGLQATERLQSLIRVPPQLIDAISTNDRVDRPALTLACNRLTTALGTAALPEQSESLRQSGSSVPFPFHPNKSAKLFTLHERLNSLSNQISRLVRLNTEARLAAEQSASVLSAALDEWPMYRLKIVVEVARLIALVRSLQHAWFDDIQREEWRKLVDRLAAADRDLIARRQELEARMKPIVFCPEGRDSAMRLLPFRPLWKEWLPRWRTASRHMQKLYCDPPPRSRAILLRDASELSRWHANALTFGNECRAIQSSFVCDADQNIRWQAVLDGIRAVELLQDLNCTSNAAIHSLCGDTPQPRQLLCSASSRLTMALNEAWQTIEEVGNILSVSVIDRPLKHVRAIGEAGQLIGQVGVFRREWFDDAKWQSLLETANRLSVTDHELTKQRETLQARFLPIAFTREGRDAAHLLLSFRSFWARFFPPWKMARRQMESVYQDSLSKTRKRLLRDASELSSFHVENERFDYECHAIEAALVRDSEQKVCWRAVLDGLRAVQLLRDADCVTPALVDALCSAEPKTRDHLCSLTSQFGPSISAAEQASGEIGNVLSARVEDWPVKRLKILVEFGDLLAKVGIFSREWFDSTQRQELPTVVNRLSATDHDLTRRREAMQNRFKPISFQSEGRDIAECVVPFRRFWKRWLHKWKVVRKQWESFYHEDTLPTRATLFRDAKELRRFNTANSRFQNECRSIESAIIHDDERRIRWQAMLDGIQAVELLREIGGFSPHVIESLCRFGSGACEVLHSAGTRLGDAIRTFELELQGVQQLLANDDICGDDIHAWRSALKYDQTTSLANIHPSLSALSRVLQQATEWSGELREATESFRRALTVPIQDPPLGLLPKLIELGKVISETDAFCPVWFEPEKVRGLREVIPRIEVADEQLAARRRELERRFLPNAFGVKGEQLAARYQEIAGVWHSLFPPLRSLRRHARRLYRGNVPRSPKEFFQEMRQLSRHHRQSAMLVDERRVFDEAYVRGEDGTVSLHSVVEVIDAVRSLQASRSIPGTVRDQCRVSHQIDLKVFVPARESLEKLLTTFEQHLSAVRQRFECSDTGNSAAARQKPTASAYADELRATAAGFAAHAEKLARVVGLLRDESDLRIDEVAGKIKSLQKVSDLRDQIRRQHAEIQAAVGEDETPERRDWNDPAERARFLKNLLDEHRDAIPDVVANVLVESEHRSQMTVAFDAASDVISDRFQSDLDFLRRLFPLTVPVSSGLVVCQSSLSTLSEWLQLLVGQLSQLHEWITYRQIESELTRLGVHEVLLELIAQDYSVEQVETAFLARLYRLWLDEVYRADPALAGFRVDDHERIIQEFRTLDRFAIESGTRQIRAKLLNDPERPHAAVFGAPATSEFGILSREVNKKKRHLPLRQLFARVPNLLVRLKPCLMMSPLAVSTYLESPEFQFDVVIFDEASQVLPWDAIGAVYRGRQLVVAGDQKQLPPSTFFDRMVNNDDDPEDADDLGDFESVLDVLCSIGLPRKRLRWHYRSRREPLIAFSNHHFYDDDLVTFPSPDDLDGSTAVRFVHVPDGRWRSKAGFNHIEAKRTAELVLEHIQQHGSRSLGVITFNLRQQLAVLDELTELRQNRPDIESFFREDRHEPFFVKNLENVQGDERDRIILSVAYGLNEETGRDSMSFGPLNRAGGERRLNVAVTRAREAITLVSSIDSGYIDLNRTKSRGARLLRAYLDYAERGPAGLSSKSAETGGHFESPFEEAVANSLKELGLDVRSQIGCGGFRIDLAIVHPDHPGCYVLGIECDGATYHRTVTARDRDRIRQEVLEELGWGGKLIRIWSTDWIRNPSRQIERITNAFREALQLPVSSPTKVAEISPPLPESEPILRIRDYRATEPTPSFTNIDDVSDETIARVVLRLAVTYGATPREDLIRSSARELGFERTGKRISSRIESVIQSLVQQRRLRDAGDERIGTSV